MVKNVFFIITLCKNGFFHKEKRDKLLHIVMIMKENHYICISFEQKNNMDEILEEPLA